MAGVPNAAAPSGTVTFLFTDIEGSTQRWDRDRAAMESAVRTHDGIMRAAIETHAGHVFKTVGDSFYAVFARPEDAALAALDAQRKLAAADFSAVDGLHVRMAINTGSADERDGDYFGPALNRVARLLAMGHGGQILLTAVSARLLHDALPKGASLTVLGRHALKDLKSEELVHQLSAPNMREEFPALRGSKLEQPWLVPDAMRTHYFTGRDDLFARLRKQLAERGRAALCGLGGAGKTQAAMEFAVRSRADYPAGVFWVNAETVEGSTTGFAAIAHALDLPAAAAGDQAKLVPSVLAWFEEHDGWLLILDNVENRREVERFAPRPGKGHLLVTSREPVFQELGIPRALEVVDLEGDEGTRFLLARTGRGDAADAERAAARELAAELGNLPLALEQAAAYVVETDASFTSYLAAFRKRRVALLERSRELVARETVAVTWDANFAQIERASPASADVLRLGAVLGPDALPFELFETAGDDELTMAETLRPLARYSLVRVDAASRTFGVHRLVQEIVRTSLGEDACRAYVERALDILVAAFPGSHFEMWERCARLLPHVVALETQCEAYAIRNLQRVRLLNRASRYLTQRGRYAEAEGLLRGALAMADYAGEAGRMERADALLGLAVIYQREMRFAESEPMHVESLAIRESVLGVGHPELAASYLNFGNLYIQQGRYDEALAKYEQARAAYTEASGENSDGVATVYNNIARVHEFRGEYEKALTFDERSYAIRHRIFGEEHPHVALSLSMIAKALTRRGDRAEAEAMEKRALEIRERTLGADHDEVAESLNDLGWLYVSLGRYDAARELFDRAVTIGERSLGAQNGNIALSLRGLAAVAMHDRRFDDAERLLARTLEVCERVFGPVHTDVASALLDRAALYAELGRRQEALALLERALAIKKQIMIPGHSEVAAIEARLASLRAKVD
jgi:class 3 adenylate cyclase/tetratricopeptide (TPR) repeat protein